MNRNELIQKLQDIEWEDFEVKEAKSELPKNIWETVSSFSNTAGGWRVLGVKKTGKMFDVQGVSNLEKIEHDFLTVLRSDKFNKKLTPVSKKYKINGNTVLGFYIPSASAKDKPLYYNSLANTFIRTGSGDQRATKAEIDTMYRNSSFDKKDEELTKCTLKDLDSNTIKRYRTYLENVNPGHRYNGLSTLQFLEKLKVIVNGKVTVGGLLVFGTEDGMSRVISDFRIDYLEIMGTSYSDAPERYQYRLPEEINIFNYYFSIFERLIKKIEIPFKMRGAFRDENQPQVKAIREALVNLLMHTDYFSNAKPRIRTFLDRIEFFNPGSLPKDIKYIIKEDFSLPRNPTVAKIFRIINLSENIGSGFDKMLNGWKAHYKNTPEITGDFDYYKIIFRFNKPDAEIVAAEGLVERLAESQQKILELIKQNPYISKKELANKIAISDTAIDKNISQLKKKGLLKRIGHDKGGHWEIIKRNNKDDENQ
ncbi:MAG: Divergent AAA domain protein [Elusimicrobia bacterium ADurb.Bin231]|nr:MAG: Divergent AAA domain protein [Elusimicrobia bacterium ADurb.Bin231]